MENLRLAFQARKRFAWAGTVPEPIFLNDVLPYASLDEPRDVWRAEFLRIAGELVRDSKTASEAAQTLNREFFKKINVHYNLGRKRNNQGPLGSIDEGKATCTGLAILLVDACRAVGVPARIAGVPEWSDKHGNHTWVEIWDRGCVLYRRRRIRHQGLKSRLVQQRRRTLGAESGSTEPNLRLKLAPHRRIFPARMGSCLA